MINLLNLLPDELIELIIYELGLKDTLSFCSIDKRLQKQCHEQLWEIMYWQFYGDIDIKIKPYQELVKLCYHLTNLIEHKPFNKYNANQLYNKENLNLSLIIKIPKEINQLLNLKDLNLQGNKLTHVPKEITELIFLKYLNLENNLLITLPKEIGNLNLKNLYLAYNNIISLPKEIGNLKLKILYLDHNKLTTIPKEIGKLSKLHSLSLGCNQLKTIPNISNLNKLRYLYLDFNQLTSIPTSLNQLTQTRVWLEGNAIKDLPSLLPSFKFIAVLK